MHASWQPLVYRVRRQQRIGVHGRNFNLDDRQYKSMRNDDDNAATARVNVCARHYNLHESELTWHFSINLITL